MTLTVRQNGAAIRQLRRERGIKTGDLAGRVGVVRSTLVNAETGYRQASVEVLYRIAGALDVPIDKILSDAGRKELAQP